MAGAARSQCALQCSWRNDRDRVLYGILLHTRPDQEVLFPEGFVEIEKAKSEVLPDVMVLQNDLIGRNKLV